jgi:hypothetical protein
MFADDWAGSLNPGDRELYESHLAACSTCRQELESLNRLWTRLGTIPREEPGPESRQRFYAMLDGYSRGLDRSQTGGSRRTGVANWFAPIFRLRPVFQLGLGILLLVGGFLSGYIIRSARNGQEEMASLRGEIHEMRQMITISLLKQQSASERLRGVSLSSLVSRPDPDFLSTLIHTLDYDPSVDVRLAAVDALSRFATHAAVRQDLVRSLPRQDSPLVQISLIDLLVQLHERQSIDVLRQLVNDVQQNPQVRDRARWGLQQLS